MNETCAPSGVVPDGAAVSSELSQWLYLHTCLGKGYLSPFPYTPVWTITSGVPSVLINTVKAAEHAFHETHEQSIAADRAKLDELEDLHKRSKSPSYNGTPQAKAAQAEISGLKAKLARPVYVNVRDWTADRSTFLELLAHSKFRAMSFTDELGTRAHGYVTSKFLAAKNLSVDVHLLNLVGDQSGDSVLIRSSATGGANMLSLRSKDPARFNMLTFTTPQAIGTLTKRLKSIGPCQGIVLTLPATPTGALAVQPEHVLKVITKVYAAESPEHRLSVALAPGWERFLQAKLEDYPVTSDAAFAAVANSLSSLETLVHSVARAIITRRVFLDESRLEEPTEGRFINLCEEDLFLAQAWVAALFEQVFGLKHLAVRTENAALARAARNQPPSAGELAALRLKLILMIQADPDELVPATVAGRAGITERLLGYLLEAYPGTFSVTEGRTRRDNPRAPIKRAIVLLWDWEHDTGTPPPSVTNAELMTQVADHERASAGLTHPPSPVGGPPPSNEPGADVPEAQVRALYVQWRKEAQDRLKAGGRPALCIQESGLAPALRPVALAVRRMFWQSTALIPSADDGRGLELWFRYGPDCQNMCAWDYSFRNWKLAEKWREKDDEAEAERRQSDHHP